MHTPIRNTLPTCQLRTNLYPPFYSAGEDTIANSAHNIVASVDTLSTTMKCISEPIVDEPGPPPVYKLPVEEKMCMSVDRSGRKIC